MEQGESALREVDLGEKRRARSSPGGLSVLEEHRLHDALVEIAIRWVDAPSEVLVELDLRFPPPWRILHLGELRGTRLVRATTTGGAEVRERYLDEDARSAVTLTWATDGDDEPTARLDLDHAPLAPPGRAVDLTELGEGWSATATPLAGVELVDVHIVPEARVGVSLRWITDTEPEPEPALTIAPRRRKPWALAPLAFLSRSRDTPRQRTSVVPTSVVATVAVVAVVAAAAIGGLIGLRDDPRDVALEASGIIEGPTEGERAEAPAERGLAGRIREALLGLLGSDNEKAQGAVDLRFREERSEGFLSRLNLAPGDVTVGELNLTRASGDGELELSFRFDVELFGFRRGERLDDALFVGSATYWGIDILAEGSYDADGDGRVSFREFSVGHRGLPAPPREGSAPFRVELVFDPRTDDDGTHFRPQRLETTIYFDLQRVTA